MIQETLKNLIEEALEKLEIESTNFSVEHPADLSMGDYSTNVAMVLAKSLNENPKDIAEKIIEECARQDLAQLGIFKVESKNGFINFYLSPSYYFNKIKQILKEKENYGKSNLHIGKKILIEHSSPNLFKPFHIGHVMNNAIGESINRFARFSGAEVTTISYPSDVSLGIGKAVWAFMRDGVEKLNALKPSKITREVKAKVCALKIF